MDSLGFTVKSGLFHVQEMVVKRSVLAVPLLCAVLLPSVAVGFVSTPGVVSHGSLRAVVGTTCSVRETPLETWQDAMVWEACWWVYAHEASAG